MLSNISKKSLRRQIIAPPVSLDNICYLINYETVEDENGYEIEQTEDKKMVFCAEVGVYSDEHYKAAQHNIRASAALLIDTESYNGQEVVEYNDVIYSVYRVYPREDGRTELYLTKKAGVK